MSLKQASAAALQVKAKYNATMADLFREAFCWLPLAHCLNGKVLVVHGGLFSRDGVTLDELRQIDRFRCARARQPHPGSFMQLLCMHARSGQAAQDRLLLYCARAGCTLAASCSSCACMPKCTCERLRADCACTALFVCVWRGRCATYKQLPWSAHVVAVAGAGSRRRTG